MIPNDPNYCRNDCSLNFSLNFTLASFKCKQIDYRKKRVIQLIKCLIKSGWVDPDKVKRNDLDSDLHGLLKAGNLMDIKKYVVCLNNIQEGDLSGFNVGQRDSFAQRINRIHSVEEVEDPLLRMSEDIDQEGIPSGQEYTLRISKEHVLRVSPDSLAAMAENINLLKFKDIENIDGLFRLLDSDQKGRNALIMR